MLHLAVPAHVLATCALICPDCYSTDVANVTKMGRIIIQHINAGRPYWPLLL